MGGRKTFFFFNVETLTSSASAEEELHRTVQGLLLLSGEEAGGKLPLLPMVLHALTTETVTGALPMGTGTSLTILLSPFTGHLFLLREDSRVDEGFGKEGNGRENERPSSPPLPRTSPPSGG